MITFQSIGNDPATVWCMTTLGDYIRDQRVAMGFRTQGEFAEHAGINRAHLSQIESGKIALPNADLRRRLARALGVTHVEILVRAGELDRAEVSAMPELSREMQALKPSVDAYEWNDEKLQAAVGALRAIGQMGQRQ